MTPKPIPDRIQRKRTKGATLPPNTVYIGRGSQWGNPFAVRYQTESDIYTTPTGWYVSDGILTRGPYNTMERAVGVSILRYERWARRMLAANPTWLDKLRKAEHLACWCAISSPCHTDVLIKLLAELETE